MTTQEGEEWDVIDYVPDYQVSTSTTFSASVPPQSFISQLQDSCSGSSLHDRETRESLQDSMVSPEPQKISTLNADSTSDQSKNVIETRILSQNTATQHLRKEHDLNRKLSNALHGYEFTSNLQNSKKAKMKLIDTALKFSDQRRYDTFSLLHVVKNMLYDLRVSNLHEDVKKSIVIALLDIVSDTISDVSVSRKFRNWLSVDCVPTMNFLYELTPQLFKSNHSTLSEWWSTRK